MKKTLFCAAAALALWAAPALHATITFNLQADLLKNQSGTPVPQSGFFMLVASTANKPFNISSSIAAGSSTALGTLLGGDDMIVYRGALSGSGVLDSENVLLDYNSTAYQGLWSAGEPLALLWFPTLTLSNSTFTNGASFGFYDGGVATAANTNGTSYTGVDGSRNWTSPASGTSAYALTFYTKDGSTLSPNSAASNAAPAGNSAGSVVPEPGSAVLLLTGATLVMLRRWRLAL